MEDAFELLVELGDSAVIHEEIIGSNDGAAFFEVFDFAVVAFADLLSVKRAFGSAGDTLIAQGFGRDNGDESQLAGEFVFKNLVFGPRVNAIEDDAFLTGGDEIFGFGDGLADDPIFAFGGADHLAKFVFAIRGDFDTALCHFFVNHAAKIDFWHTVFGEIINRDGFAAATHADDGDDFDVS